MQLSSLTGMIHQSSEQHIDLGESRIERDMKDLETIKTWFNEHPPFTNVPGLMSIANGLTATNESKVV